MKNAHYHWVEQALKEGPGTRQPHWSESIAVGSEEFTLRTEAALGFRIRGRQVIEATDHYELKEDSGSYNADVDPKKDDIGPKNSYFRCVN